MTPPSSIDAMPAKTAALFVSDLHLQPSLPRTTQAFIDFLQHYAQHTRQLYLLGDLFEYWVGDDDLIDPYHQRTAEALRQISSTGTEILIIVGNRDFLLGATFAQAAGARLLPDPFVTTLAGKRVALTHGDAQCTDDQAYMQFRAQVRDLEWQRQFLALPLAERKKIAADFRMTSQRAQQTKIPEITDVNLTAIDALFASSDADILIHGHTHRPACHLHTVAGRDRMRYVLPDWDCDGTIPRGGWLTLSLGGTFSMAMRLSMPRRRPTH